GLPCQQPEFPYLGAAVFGEEAGVVHISRERLLGLDSSFAKDVAGTNYGILRVRAGFSLKGQRFLEVEGDDRLLGELQHEVAQRADGYLLGDLQTLCVVTLGVATVDFLLGGCNERV